MRVLSWVMRSPRRWAAALRRLAAGAGRPARTANWRAGARTLRRLPCPLSAWTRSPRPAAARAADLPRLVAESGAVTARDEILARVRHGPGRRPDARSGAPRYRAAGDRPPTRSAELFVDRLADYRARVHRTESRPAGLLAGVGRDAGPVDVPAGCPPAAPGGCRATPPADSARAGRLDAVADRLRRGGRRDRHHRPRRRPRAGPARAHPGARPPFCVVRAGQVVGLCRRPSPG